jgi:hypothetical protein
LPFCKPNWNPGKRVKLWLTLLTGLIGHGPKEESGGLIISGSKVSIHNQQVIKHRQEELQPKKIEHADWQQCRWFREHKHLYIMLRISRDFRVQRQLFLRFQAKSWLIR